MDNSLRIEAKHKIAELYDSLDEEDKYCNGCIFLDIKPPYKGVTTSDINVWRDSYKATCEQFSMVWTNQTKNKITRVMECVVLNGKCTV